MTEKVELTVLKKTAVFSLTLTDEKTASLFDINKTVWYEEYSTFMEGKKMSLAEFVQLYQDYPVQMGILGIFIGMAFVPVGWFISGVVAKYTLKNLLKTLRHWH